MARRRRLTQLTVKWHEVDAFDPSSVSAELWHTARHEAGHFLAAVVHGHPAPYVWLRTPGGSHGAWRKGKLGSVSTSDPRGHTPENVAVILAGVNVDYLILGFDCQHDPGSRHDLDHAKREIILAMRDRHPNGLNRSTDYTPTDAEISAVAGQLGVPMLHMLESNWWLIECLAACFLTHVAKKTGEVHPSYVRQFYDMAKAETIG